MPTPSPSGTLRVVFCHHSEQMGHVLQLVTGTAIPILKKLKEAVALAWKHSNSHSARVEVATNQLLLVVV